MDAQREQPPGPRAGLDRDIDLPGLLPDRPCGFVNACLSGVCQSGDSQEWIQDQTQPRTGLR
jgi:hypothetical protein